VGILYLVSTPIGNLDDITLRAVNILRQVELIAAEDTRHTRKLLHHFGIHTKLTSYHEHNKLKKIEVIFNALSLGNIALVSDAGTPGLNDPGYELVKAALEAGHTVSPIPGPSAPIAALVSSGLPTDSFLYLGYLPRKSSDRRSRLSTIAGLPYTLVFLEAPHRIVAALEDMLNSLGDRKIAIARELTKLHEEIYRGYISDALTHISEGQPKGEFTLVVSGCKPEPEKWPEHRLLAVLKESKEDDVPPSQIASQVSAQSGWPRREVYRLLLDHSIQSREGNNKD